MTATTSPKPKQLRQQFLSGAATISSEQPEPLPIAFEQQPERLPPTATPTSPKRRPPRFLSAEDLKERGIPFSRVQLWRLMKAGKFPRPVQISEQRNAWREEDIDHWMATRPRAVGKSEAAGVTA
jgi:prophage regulatory protein